MGHSAPSWDGSEALARIRLARHYIPPGEVPGEEGLRISTCFSKALKQRRLDLYREDPDEHRIFLLYHQGQWRMAYFEDDRPLMEEVLATPVMQETIQRLRGVVATEAENNKRRQTLLTAYAAPSRDEATGAIST